MDKFHLTLMPGRLKLSDLYRAYFHPLELELDPGAWPQIDAARSLVVKTLDEGEVIYGINTGFGRLAQSQIDSTQLRELQRNLLHSHAAGVGPLLDDAVVRLILLLKINALAQGYSGVRRDVILLLMELLNREIYPVIPAKGSVGASGDLAPLAHMSLVLIGEGEVRLNGEIHPTARVFHQQDLRALVLQAKEGLGLINGTQVSTALGLSGLFAAERNANAAFLAGSMTLESVLGSHMPFAAAISQIRCQPGQIEAARIYRQILTTSEINRSHAQCDRVQDPYSLRCMPQVMGACLDQMQFAAKHLAIEANAVTDNPLIFSAENEIVSGGNFHAEPVAMAADNLALAIAEIGALAERRIALLIDSSLSQLPPFLVEDAGVNSGFMIAQVTAAALASENKSLAHPACVDSLPTSANQEDHVSMATFAARRLSEMNDNTRFILAVELLAAAQGIDLRRPLTSTPTIENAHREIRRVVSTWNRDRYLQPDLETVAEMIGDNKFGDWVSEYMQSSVSA